MVHKHDASRLHYDLRLEIDGALASWAIPKGPSFDPKVRRLAVQTEDHPLEYGTFEGRIPEGEYGAGDALVWDRGTFETEPPGAASQMREKGHLAFRLDGEKLRGRWHLVRTQRGDGRSWILVKARDAFASAKDIVAERPESLVSGRTITRGPVRAASRRASHPDPIDLLLRVWPPMLATNGKPDDVPDRAIFEVKYDGFRALAGVSHRAVSLQSRNALDLSARFPTVARALAKIEAAEVVLDGELISYDTRGRPSFEALHDPARPIVYAVFDVLWLDGEDLRARPLRERREILESVLGAAPEGIVPAERMAGDVRRVMAEAKRRGLEGIIAKDTRAPYRGGRARAWLKLKLVATQDVVIVGYLPLSNGEHGVGALLVAVHEGGALRFAGKVGTGFTQRMRSELQTALDGLRSDSVEMADKPRWRDAQWTKPVLVGEVAFTEWTRDGKFRHPRFRGLRDDKTPDECVREGPAIKPPAARSGAPKAPPKTGRRNDARARARRPPRT